MSANPTFPTTSATIPFLQRVLRAYLRAHSLHRLHRLSLGLARRWKKRRPGIVVCPDTGSDGRYHISPVEIKRERILDLQTIVLLLTSIK